MPSPTIISDFALTGLLKNVYSQFRMKVQNLVTPLRAQLQTAQAGGIQNLRWGGSGVYWNVTVGRPAGATFSSGGFLGVDAPATEVQATVGITRAYVTRQVDGLAFLGTQSAEAAFETLARKTMEELRNASELLMQRGLHGASNGVAAAVAGVTGTTVLTLTSPYGVSGAGQGGLLLAVGDYLAVRDSTGATLRGRSTVAAFGHTGDTCVVTLSPGMSSMAATDIVVHSSQSDDSFNAAMNGLINITNRGGSYGTLHGLTASVNPIWDTKRLAAGTDTPSSAQLTESDVWELLKRIEGFSGKSAMNRPSEFLLLTTPGVNKNLMESFVGQRQFIDPRQFSVQINGGYRAVSVCGVATIEDYYAPAGTFYALHKPSLAMVDGKDWGTVEFEGAGAPYRWIQGRDAFETSYGWYGNLACLQRNSHGQITGITDTNRYSHI